MFRVYSSLRTYDPTKSYPNFHQWILTANKIWRCFRISSIYTAFRVQNGNFFCPKQDIYSRDIRKRNGRIITNSWHSIHVLENPWFLPQRLQSLLKQDISLLRYSKLLKSPLQTLLYPASYSNPRTKQEHEVSAGSKDSAPISLTQRYYPDHTISQIELDIYFAAAISSRLLRIVSSFQLPKKRTIALFSLSFSSIPLALYDQPAILRLNHALFVIKLHFYKNLSAASGRLTTSPDRFEIIEEIRWRKSYRENRSAAITWNLERAISSAIVSMRVGPPEEIKTCAIRQDPWTVLARFISRGLGVSQWNKRSEREIAKLEREYAI